MLYTNKGSEKAYLSLFDSLGCHPIGVSAPIGRKCFSAPWPFLQRPTSDGVRSLKVSGTANAASTDISGVQYRER